MPHKMSWGQNQISSPQFMMVTAGWLWQAWSSFRVDSVMTSSCYHCTFLSSPCSFCTGEQASNGNLPHFIRQSPGPVEVMGERQRWGSQIQQLLPPLPSSRDGERPFFLPEAVSHHFASPPLWALNTKRFPPLEVHWRWPPTHWCAGVGSYWLLRTSHWHLFPSAFSDIMLVA